MEENFGDAQGKCRGTASVSVVPTEERVIMLDCSFRSPEIHLSCVHDILEAVETSLLTHRVPKVQLMETNNDHNLSSTHYASLSLTKIELCSEGTSSTLASR